MPGRQSQTVEDDVVVVAVVVDVVALVVDPPQAAASVAVAANATTPATLGTRCMSSSVRSGRHHGRARTPDMQQGCLTGTVASMEPADAPERLGDLLALARRAWVQQMRDGLRRRGFDDYRRPDALVFRLLRSGPVPVGRLGTVLDTTRQAGRKVVDGLEKRGYATTAPDPLDARRTNVILTPRGERYAAAVVAVVEELNRELVARVDPDDLEATRVVLLAIIGGGVGPEDAR